MILALAGGVGGAKLAHGLVRILSPDGLVIAVNTGDDFEHLGLHISPDLDSVMYKLAGLNDTERGWGLADESWHFMEALARLEGETWFNLGDRDLATHVERTRRLAAGETLSHITAALCGALGIEHRIVPMTDSAVHTMVTTEAGTIPFQDYFVRLRCEPVVTGFSFAGAESARPTPAFTAALKSADLSAIVICPSNPYVSIDPILSLADVAAALEGRRVPLVAVSPIIGGGAIKGPAAKMMAELGLQPSAASIASHYGRRLDGLVIDQTDGALAPKIEAMGIPTHVAQTIMKSADDERTLAQEVLTFAASLNVRSK
ncbi:MAG: 2-phospho-L-lactate transferase [Proteobacteria bacterium]|nr:2-phospho-L-lactate transferase [Pseudomonadota bacterium]MDA1323219.1 2-phospho-L-lactate transferase [Pseudomonadota bacterium]